MIRTTSTFLKIAAAAAASVALAGTAFAHPHEGGEKSTVEQVIVLPAKPGTSSDERVRSFRMLRSEGGEFTCPNGDATKIDESTGGDRTKILICSDDKLSGGERAKKLEETLTRMRGENHLGAEHKAKVEAALEQAIARLRAAN